MNWLGDWFGLILHYFAGDQKEEEYGPQEADEKSKSEKEKIEEVVEACEEIKREFPNGIMIIW